MKASNLFTEHATEGETVLGKFLHAWQSEINLYVAGIGKYTSILIIFLSLLQGFVSHIYSIICFANLCFALFTIISWLSPKPYML